MKSFFTLLSILSFSFCWAQTNTHTENYKSIQGKWICSTPPYKKHTFWVRGISFFQKYKGYTMEQHLPTEIDKATNNGIHIIGLLVKCDECFNDVWTVIKLTPSELVLANDKTDETVVYKKGVKRK